MICKPIWKSGRSLLCGASLTVIAAGLGAAPALAQDAAQQAAGGNQVQEVVVTGFRSSLAQALNVKRESTVEADTILAEDIGKFPDLNLSESIQRIPGVALAR